MANNQIIADLQLHSKYSRAVSKNMVVPIMAAWGRKKGIDLLATGDWMHSLWFRELQANLVEVAEGIYESKEELLGDPPSHEASARRGKTRFLLSTEISSIYSKGGKGRRVHTLVFAPNFSVAGKINEELLRRGCNLSSDGRPIVGLSAAEIAEVVLSIDEKCLVIPAHAWTPWFALYGSKSGFDSIEECFGEFSNKIYAVETGLSSDPLMNWRIKELERRAIVSFSDAHSPGKLGREATVFKFADRLQTTDYSYNDIYWAIGERFLGRNEGRLKIHYTIEFYPEEGKYHYTGHRKCGVVQSPEETRKNGIGCPVCGRPLTVGVEHRVEQLARREITPENPPAGGLGTSNNSITNDQLEQIKKTNGSGVVFNYHPSDETRPPYVMMVPLLEILAEVHGVAVGAKRVSEEYERLVGNFGSEFEVLLRTSGEDLQRVGGERLAEAIRKVRSQDIAISPGYDGEFGKVKIWPSDAKAMEGKKAEQMGLF